MIRSATPANRSRKWGGGTASIVRVLIATDAPMTGVAIAAAVGLTQPRASQVLSYLAEHEAVDATSLGFVGRADRLLDLYESRARPSLASPETFWFSTRPQLDQARRVARHAAVEGARVGFSADLATDLLVPWRHPTLTVVYSDTDLDLQSAGLVPAEGRSDASVIVRPTNDASLLSPAPGWPNEVSGIPLVDPVQQWWDLLDLGGRGPRRGSGAPQTGDHRAFHRCDGMTVMLHVQRLRLGRGRVAHDRWHDAGRRHRPS